jgi:hypothetical protein
MDAEEHYYAHRVYLPPFREERLRGGGEEVGGQIEGKRQGEQLYIYPAG